MDGAVGDLSSPRGSETRGRTRFTGYQRYLIVVLALVYTCHLIDRTMVMVLLEPIKEEFRLTDTQLGLFSGLIFSTGTFLAAAPLGALADRTSRKRLLAICIAVCSSLTLLCGLSTTYVTLLLSRFGVGAGEGGLQPTALSILGDETPPERRARAVALVHLGIPLGVVTGFLLGGSIAQSFGWRAALFIVGAPGLLLAALVAFTVREPPRGSADPAASQAKIGLREFVRLVRADKALTHVIIGLVVLWFCTSSYSAWYATFLVRTHHLDVRTTGALMALVSGGGGFVGNLVSGALADRFAGKRMERLAAIAVVGALIYLPLGLLTMIIGDLWFLAPILFLQNAVYFAVFTPGYSLALSLSDPRIRGRVFATITTAATLIGYGLGPQVVGLLSDIFKPWAGIDSLRYALMAAVLITLWTMIHFALAYRHLRGRTAQN